MSRHLDYPVFGEEVLPSICSLGESQAPIRMTWQYKGVELSQDVTIQTAGADWAAIHVTNDDLLSISEHVVHLHALSLPYPVVARVNELDVNKGLLWLSKFAYSDAEWMNRSCDRVQPREPTYVSVQCHKCTVRAFLENVSTHGMGLLGYKFFEKGLSLYPGVKIEVNFNTLADNQAMNLHGTLVHIKNLGGSLLKLGVRMQPRSRHVRLLTSYIARRRDEILQEVRQAYAQVYRPMSVESMYF